MVCTRCFTFNQASYIEDAMNGFTMQETSFPVVTIIVDDASTDGEQEIIQRYLDEHFEEPYRKDETEYANIICSKHRTNPNCIFVVFFLKYNHYSIKKSKIRYLSEWLDNAKYSALCEGDDYWTHPKKLQMQVDFMEDHPDHSLCFHANSFLYSDGQTKEYYPYKEDVEVCPMNDIIGGGGSFMATNSMLYVYELGKGFRKTWAKSCQVGDLPLMLTLAVKGKVGYLNEIMSCYRYVSEGSWTQRVSRNKKELRKFHKGSSQLWREFDNWTNYKYHKIIRLRIIRITIRYWIKQILFRFSFVKNIFS